MATTHLVSVEEYLHSSYEPDAEYVDGRIIHRALPKKPHSKMQSYLDRTLYTAMHPSGYEVWVEQRIRTRPDPARYRVPDVCVTLGEPPEDIFTAPPFLCVEVLSPDDTAVGVRTKVEEYLTFGVSHVWVIDPAARSGEIHTRSGIQRVDDGRFIAGSIEIDIRQA
ncbi:MAG TPA: Uma2 family endonuclease [Bryobacteraceae bacterium]|jgi:Uma2 family endonuclease|nr:Uma2 family endonuclease [Bryobacteraceae bacterium]